MSDSNRWNTTAHITLGIVAGFFNLGLLYHWHEDNQLPPENRENPVLFCKPNYGPPAHWIGRLNKLTGGHREYWAAPRVLDVLKDLREYQIGQTVGWFAVVIFSAWIGARFF